jgi:hypothetical protein
MTVRAIATTVVYLARTIADVSLLSSLVSNFQAFLVLRRHANLIINLFVLMSTSGEWSSHLALLNMTPTANLLS